MVDDNLGYLHWEMLYVIAGAGVVALVSFGAEPLFRAIVQTVKRRKKR